MASARALVQLLRGMARTRVATPFRAALPILGRDGSLAHTGTTLPARGHVFAKPGTTIVPAADGSSLELKAQTMAGYISTRSGRNVAFALMVRTRLCLAIAVAIQGAVERVHVESEKLLLL